MNTGKNTIPDISANVLRTEKNNGCVCSEKSDNRSCDKLDQYGDGQTKSNGDHHGIAKRLLCTVILSGIDILGDCFRPQKKTLGKILNIGIPVALQDGFIQIAFIIITIIANRRGLNAAAAVGIVEKIISFLFLVPRIFTTQATAIKYIGLLESPSPRKIELITLYAVIKGIPIKQIVR